MKRTQRLVGLSVLLGLGCVMFLVLPDPPDGGGVAPSAGARPPSTPVVVAPGQTVPELSVIETLLRKAARSDLYPVALYYGDVFVPRSDPAPKHLQYNPGARAYLERQVGAEAIAFAARVYGISRDPSNLRKRFEENKALLQKVVSRDLYRKRFAPDVERLLRVYHHSMAHPGHGQIYARIAKVLEAHHRILLQSEDKIPSRINPFTPALFETSYLESLGTALEAVWAHSFWFRRYQESNLHEVYGILVDVHRLYGLSPPANPYSPEGRPPGYDPAAAFMADTLCRQSVSQKVLTLSSGRKMVEVACEMQAYQGRFRYAWRDGSGPVLDGRGRPLELVGLPEFDPVGDGLTTLEKGRGAGGCGDWYRLALEGDRFVEKVHRHRSCSATDLVVEPKKWAIVPRVSSHCAAEEETVFSCHVSRTESIALCASEGRIQYRGGRLAAPEVIFPHDGRPSAFSFHGEEWLRAHAYTVSFRHGGRAYSIHSEAGLVVVPGEPDRSYGSTRIRGFKEGKAATSMKCRPPVVARWDRIRALLGAPKPAD